MIEFNIRQKIALLLIVSLAFFSCSQNPTSSKTAAILKNVNPAEAYQLIQENAENDNFVILDVRTPSEYHEGHIEDAININFYESDFRAQLEELDTTKTYLIYCRSGGRSGNTLKIMEELGFQEVYNLSSGILGWKKEGYNTN
jgi:rhodanese-related sulfurtransferase